MFRPIQQCFDGSLSGIYQRASQIEQLQKKVQALLPDNLRAFCQVSCFDKGCLVLTTTDAVWASQLRYLVPELRDNLRREGQHNLLSIKIMVLSPQGLTIKKTTAVTRMLSSSARDAIQGGIDQCNYEPLKAALKKLITPC